MIKLSSVRIKEPNTSYRVKLNALKEVSFLRDKEDKSTFIKFMIIYAIVYGINLYGYLFKNNDAQIYFFDEKGNISKFIQCIKSRYCKWYNKKYLREGTLFKDRFISEIIEAEALEDIIGKFESKDRELISINDGSLINSTLGSEIVLDELCNFFDVSKDELHIMLRFNNDMASIAAFCLRCFSNLIHKRIVKVLKCITISMSSTLSLNGVELIKGKYACIYDRLLMKIYCNKGNYCNS